MLKIGDEVYLSDEGVRCYVHEGVVHPDNPLWVKGVISADDIDGRMTLCVEWENGHRNYYDEEDLIKVTQEKPVVIGYKRTHPNGLYGSITFSKWQLDALCELHGKFRKQKFRPVYEV